MGMGYYILDGKEPIEVSDITAWAVQFEMADRIVKQTPLHHDVVVSTIFLGLDHQWGDGPPLLFETRIFGGKHDQDQWPYSTWDEAVAGHNKVVDELIWGILSRLVQWLRCVVTRLRESRKLAALDQ